MVTPLKLYDIVCPNRDFKFYGEKGMEDITINSIGYVLSYHDDMLRVFIFDINTAVDMFPDSFIKIE